MSGESKMLARNHIAIVIGLAISLLAPVLAQDSSPSPDDWDWMNKHYNQMLDELLPMKPRGGTYLSYRSHRDLYTEILEYSFFIGHQPKKNAYGVEEYLSAHVRVADSVSIYDQMMEIHRSKPGESTAVIQKRIKVKAWDLTEKSCPAVLTQFVKFNNLSFRPPEFDALVLHPLVHEFHVVAGLGDIDLSLVDNEHPLVLWALETRKALDACIAEPSSPNQPAT